ncbi:flagellar export protein FliJ [Arthrobacter sp. STN4]|uniref:flagellar export protein FliJ n=1 Tax=Arthrobacter sp. STN4 TaxID=2923276 RepID=UPI00211A61DA|nr:flagellar export protein FliJ [Arthrobacter sp. STN4]MCQ9162505.1 flagellar export protein FliJ [Arthrobacter sp. STN4]
MTKTFRLAALLRFRKLQEDQAAAGLARANANRRTHASRTAAAWGELAQTTAEAGSATALTAAAASRAASRSILLELQGLGTAMAAEAETAEAELVAAKTAASTLEKLAERHRQAGSRADLAAEQHFLDELATARRTGPQ